MNDRSGGRCANFTAINPKTRATSACPATFAAFDNPSDRCRRTLMRSSMNPTRPRPMVANTTDNPAAVTVVNTTRVTR
jgi:hypothetical protein